MSKYAIIETGSKQYYIEPNSVLEVEKLEVPEDKKEIHLENVLLVRDENKLHIGTPYVKGAKVVCQFLGHFRGPKVIHFKFKRRKDSRRKKGHRQELSRLRVKEIKG
ncbi:MAG: 50S ribosomal protein L21 [Candidatus Omnitrophica bacterium]|nr:50S ribosomal protein L21 [Candidatus Omnitrophota bacterium]